MLCRQTFVRDSGRQSNAYAYALIRYSATLSPISRVPRSLPPSSMMSPVRQPSSKTLETASSMHLASSSRLKLSRSIMAQERMVAMGFALFWPAMSGALP